MRDLKSENASEHSSFATTSVHTVEDRLEELMSRLIENLAKYGERHSLNQLHV